MAPGKVCTITSTQQPVPTGATVTPRYVCMYVGVSAIIHEYFNP